MDYWPGLIELYEYKVDDLVAGRTPRGGKYALTDLRRTLLAADLGALLRRRLMVSDRRYRDWRRGTQKLGELTAPPSLGWTSQAAPADETSSVGSRLRTLAWHAEITERLGQMTQDLRREEQRSTLRVLYAVTENAERAQRGVAARFAVPAADDPLASLGNKEVVEEITKSLTDLLLTPEDRQRVLRAISEVRENPFPVQPAEEAVRGQLAAAEREHLTPQSREALLRALRAQLPAAPAPHERPQIREAAVRLQRLLEEQLRLLSEGQGAPQILFAPSAHALKSPDECRSDLMIYLAGEAQETQWRGLNIRWQAAGPNWQLQLGQQLLTLYPHLSALERKIKLPETLPQVEVFYEGNYVLLRVKGKASSGLGTLAAQARAVALLLNPSEAFATLRLARAAAQELRGALLNLSALTPESAEKFALAAPDDLQEFVRQGLSTLLARIQNLSPLETRAALERCAGALQMPAWRVDKLHQALHNILHDTENISLLAPPAVAGGTRLLRPGGHFQSFRMALAGEPVNLSIKERVVTLRWDYKGDLSVLLPGYSNLFVKDWLVVALNDADLMLVRQGEQVAVATTPRQIS